MSSLSLEKPGCGHTAIEVFDKAFLVVETTESFIEPLKLSLPDDPDRPSYYSPLRRTGQTDAILVLPRQPSSSKQPVSSVASLLYEHPTAPAEKAKNPRRKSGREPIPLQQFLQESKHRTLYLARPRELSNGQLCLLERHLGTVVRVLGDEAVVRYGSQEEAFELTYTSEQFLDQTLPKRGDRIEACVALWREPHQPKGVGHYIDSSELERLCTNAEKGVRGPVEL